jgi:hypothetical protein
LKEKPEREDSLKEKREREARKRRSLKEKIA